MNRRDTVLALLALGAVPIAAEAQQKEKMYRVGWALTTTPKAETMGPEPANVGARSFLRELRALGYVEGKNLILDRVSAEGHTERYTEIVAELLRRKADVIMVSGSQLAVVAKRATSTVPIVMNSVAEPVKYGLVASLARPGANVTGISADADPETEAKRLQFLKELVPNLSRVSCLATKWIWEGPFGEVIRRGAPALGIEPLFAEHRPDDLKATFAIITRQRPDALLVVLAPDVFAQRQQIVDFAFKARIPGIYPFAEMAEAGGLMSYGYNLPDIYRLAASYVDKILKGAKPADLPVEQPTKVELVINLKAAKQIGLTIPQSLLVRADRLIE